MPSWPKIICRVCLPCPLGGGLPTLVDLNILRYENVCLNSGDQAELVCVERADFQALIREANLCTLSCPTQTINPDARLDEPQIEQSHQYFYPAAHSTTPARNPRNF